jgi:hypothetical protein
MKVQDLKAGIQFRLPGERKFKRVTKTIELEAHDNIEPKGRKILVLFDGCRQYSILKDTEVEVMCTHRLPDGSDAFEIIGHTHKEVSKCQICGETTTA